jgi:hypothetical protein
LDVQQVQDTADTRNRDTIAAARPRLTGRRPTNATSGRRSAIVLGLIGHVTYRSDRRSRYCLNDPATI